jgi:hypothetical protein
VTVALKGVTTIFCPASSTLPPATEKGNDNTKPPAPKIVAKPSRGLATTASKAIADAVGLSSTTEEAEAILGKRVAIENSKAKHRVKIVCRKNFIKKYSPV